MYIMNVASQAAECDSCEMSERQEKRKEKNEKKKKIVEEYSTKDFVTLRRGLSFKQWVLRIYFLSLFSSPTSDTQGRRLITFSFL